MYSLLFQFFANTTKVGFWLLLSVFFFSNSGVNHKTSPSSSLENVYALSSIEVSDSLVKILEHPLVFESSTSVSRGGIPFTSIEIKPADDEQLFGILISKPTKDMHSIMGRHEIDSNFNSLLSEFNGVFGYINITDVDEKPYFSYKGFLNITEINEQLVSGSLNLSFKNSEGRTVHVNKKFKAHKNKRLSLR
ncbi:hypothetical protein D9O36_15660 [Zobellia amurskyensis]|uniref:Uncharacterized protein n=1 Tax=Zobellia amurskyensis TaxID=248905 RepID=A0A7X2ZVS5_9FLAO|nr:hypothetical protein [Zobellia amurskyensis]MUH37287.1 hypothetical protein [Zobellia amurskyensis]